MPSMRCPRCHEEMTAIEPVPMALLTVNVATCRACGGRWFPHGELKKVDDVVEVTVLEFRRLPAPSEQRMPLACPHCAGAPSLEKVQNARDGDVVLDVCRECDGVWVDRGELEAIQQESLPVALANMIRWLRHN